MLGKGELRVFAVGVVSLAFVIGGCGGTKGGGSKGGSSAKVGDCTTVPAGGASGGAPQYRVVDCSSSDAQTKIVRKGTGLRDCGANEGGFEASKSDFFCVGPK